MDIAVEFQSLERIGKVSEALVGGAQVHARISIGVDLSPVCDIHQSLHQRIAAADHNATAEPEAFEGPLHEFI